MRWSWLVLILALALGKTASASVVLSQPPEALTRQASAVVRGSVLSQEAAYDAAAQVQVVRTRIQVTETWKGTPTAVITVQQIGSLRGNVVRGIAGDARFKVGEEVVLFLAEGRGSETGYWFLLGLGQGKYTVHRTDEQEPVVDRNLQALTLVRRGPPHSVEAPLPVSTLKQVVLSATGGAQ